MQTPLTQPFQADFVKLLPRPSFFLRGKKSRLERGWVPETRSASDTAPLTNFLNTLPAKQDAGSHYSLLLPVYFLHLKNFQSQRMASFLYRYDIQRPEDPHCGFVVEWVALRLR